MEILMHFVAAAAAAAAMDVAARIEMYSHSFA
jgi:hypothetical protein